MNKPYLPTPTCMYCHYIVFSLRPILGIARQEALQPHSGRDIPLLVGCPRLQPYPIKRLASGHRPIRIRGAGLHPSGGGQTG